MSAFWQGLATGVLATIVVLLIIARLVLAQLNKRGRQALEQLATDMLEQTKAK